MRRKRRLKTLILFIFVILISIAVCISFYYKKINSIEGQYTEEYDLTDIVVSNTNIWLSDIDGYDKDISWVKSHCSDFIVKINVEIVKTEFGKGTYNITVDEPSYINCQIASRDLMANCLKDIIKDKLRLNDFDEQISDADLDSLIIDALGLNLYDFITLNELTIMKDYDTFSSEINRSGVYEINYNLIKGFSDNGDLEENYYLDDNVLMLPYSQMILRRIK